MALASVGTKKMVDTKYKVTLEGSGDTKKHIELLMKLCQWNKPKYRSC